MKKKKRGNLIVNRWSFGKLDTQQQATQFEAEWAGEETAREVGTSIKWHLDIIYNQFYSTAAASSLLDSTELKFIEFVRLCLSCFGIKLDFWGFLWALRLLFLSWGFACGLWSIMFHQFSVASSTERVFNAWQIEIETNSVMGLKVLHSIWQKNLLASKTAEMQTRIYGFLLWLCERILTNLSRSISAHIPKKLFQT